MIMSSVNTAWSSPLLFFFFFLLGTTASALDQDGALLLSFKSSILADPLSTLSNWNYYDDTPCSWNGVTCMGFPDHHDQPASRVISLVLPSSRLLGSVPFDVGLIEHLRHLDLSDNLLNGTLPASLFNSSELKIISLANNDISGDIPDVVNLVSLELVNISDNGLTGTVPASLSLVPNLSVVSLSNNCLSGSLPGGGGGFGRVRVLDLSSNLFNGSVPADLVGSSSSTSLRYLNLSSNRLSGAIPSELGRRLPIGATLDFSSNNFTGGIPDSLAFLSQSPTAFACNADLCGKPLDSDCPIPSALSNPPNVSQDSPPAFAAIPKTAADGGEGGGGDSLAAESGRGTGGGFQPVTIAAIVVGDLVGIGLLVVLFLYAYQVKKRRRSQQKEVGVKTTLWGSASESNAIGGLSCCSRKKDIESDQEGSTETSSSSDGEGGGGKRAKARGKQGGATLVTVDGDTGLEMETLLKASAYILGATGTTIVYKAVISDGTALAVRRIGECTAVDKLKDFKARVRGIAKLRHPNLLRLWGFYWGPDEKLLIHDYAPNGSLANIPFSKKLGSSSPFNLNLESRLRIARGVAGGLAYIHERKSVHGNVKPSNILLGSDMEAKIGDFGLDRLLSGGRPGTSSRVFGSKRSMQSQSSLAESSPVPAAASSIVSGSVAAGVSLVRYQAPESLQNLKPNAKWDVYSFGMVLLELISGRVFSEEEIGQWNTGGFADEERNRVLRMADPALRGEVVGKEEAVLSCFRLGFACAAVAPQRRPTMKDAVTTLDRIPSTSTTYLLH